VCTDYSVSRGVMFGYEYCTAQRRSVTWPAQYMRRHSIMDPYCSGPDKYDVMSVQTELILADRARREHLGLRAKSSRA
jgi:hypothetical protein